jgi:hypothetical protein
MTNTIDEKRVDLEFDQGSDIIITLTIYDANGGVKNITGYHAMMQIRDRPGGELYDSFIDTGVSPKIVITGASGLIVITVPAATTAAYLWTKAVYDIKLTDAASGVSYPMFGDITLRSRVSQ